MPTLALLQDRPPPLLICTALLLLIQCVGCNALPAGRIESVGASALGSRPGEVYLLRGWRGLWSTGIDQLAADLQRNRINAMVFREDQWRDLADSLCTTRTPWVHRGPLIIVGFSYGADNGIALCRELASRGMSVDLLITLDPVSPPPLPSNVRKCINFYQSNGALDLFPWLRGIPLPDTGPPGRLVNQNLRTDRIDLLEADTSHATIAGNRKLHREVERRVIETIESSG